MSARGHTPESPRAPGGRTNGGVDPNASSASARAATSGNNGSAPAATSSAPLTLRFSAYELDFARKELRREGALVALQPTPLRVLLYLAKHRDRTVPRRELLDAVWPSVVVGDEALTTALAEARHAVGDDGAAQRVIRTLKGAGYRFVAEVEVVNGADAGTADESAAAARSGSRRRLASAAAAATLLAGVAAGMTFLRSPTPSPAPEAPPFTFAVLPIQTLSGAPEDRAFADGLTEQITHSLTAKGYSVVARTTAAQWKGRAADVRDLGRDLDVAHVIEGSVQREQGRVRVAMRLVSTLTGKQVWSEVIDEASDDRFRLQDRITGRVDGGVLCCADPGIDQLRRIPELAQFADSRLEMNRLGAHGKFEERLALTQRMLGGAPIGPEFRLFRAIVHTDHAISLWWILHSGERGRADAASQALAHARRAVSEASGPGTEHVLMLAQLANWQWADAERTAKKSCEAPGALPPAANAVCGVSRHWLCAAFGCAEEQLAGARAWRGSAAWLEEGFVLTPALLNNNLPEEAERVSLHAALLEPLFTPLLGSAQWRLGKRAEAVASSASWWEARGAGAFAREARRFGEKGPAAAWRWQADQLAAGAAPFTSTANDFLAARFYAELGDYEAALAALERSVHEREPGMHMHGLDVVFDPIRDTPRFRALIEEMGLTAYQAKYLKRPRVLQPVAPPVASDSALAAEHGARAAR
jgi:TolB-like protein